MTRTRALGVASLFLLVACGGRSTEPNRPSGTTAAPPAPPETPGMRSEAEWSAHCEAVTKRRVDCGFESEEEAPRDLAICKKTQKCQIEMHRSEANAPLFACEENADCDDDCNKTVEDALTPTVTEKRIVQACVTKFADNEVMCSSLGRTVRLAREEDASQIEPCIAKAKEWFEAGTCGAAALGGTFGGLRCMAEAAPDEIKASLERGRPPLPERAKTDAFGKTLPLALGAKPPSKRGRTKAPDDRAWTYANLSMRLWYEPQTGPPKVIHFVAESATKEECRSLVQAVTDEIGPPSRVLPGGGITRLWKGKARLLTVQWSTLGLHPQCSGELAAKGSRPWETFAEPRVIDGEAAGP